MEAIDYSHIHSFSVADFHKMAETGIFQENARLELIQGGIIEMAPIGTKHASIVTWLYKNLSLCAQNQVLISSQNPVVLNSQNEVYPDISVLKSSANFYADVHPQPKDALLLIEVSDTTLRYDQKTKLPLYAQSGIKEVWIIDIENRCLYAYREPQMQHKSYYLTEKVYEGSISMQTDASIQINVTELFKTCL